MPCTPCKDAADEALEGMIALALDEAVVVTICSPACFSKSFSGFGGKSAD